MPFAVHCRHSSCVVNSPLTENKRHIDKCAIPYLPRPLPPDSVGPQFAPPYSRGGFLHEGGHFGWWCRLTTK